MYLRTTRRKNRDGSEVVYYQLAHNVRNPTSGRAVAQIIHNFGRAERVQRAELVRLCCSIARVCGLEVRDPVSDGDEQQAPGDVLPKGVAQKTTRAFGAGWVIEALWERLGIGPTLRRIADDKGCRVPYERALLAMTANRLCVPESKLGVWDRWLDTVYLPGCEPLKLAHMYEAMDLLHAHADEIEKAVFFQTADLLNLDVDLIFYDTTTCSFAIDDADEDDDDGTVGLRKLGHSKEGTWTAQVVVALAVTRDGLPVRSWVLPGNTTDVTTIKRIRDDLRGWKLGRTLFVADSGMNSADNREELARACGRYVLASRLSSVAEVRDSVLGRPGRYKELADNLRVKEVVVGEGEKRRRYIVCHNPKQSERQARHREQVLTDLEEKLARHPDHDASAKWAIKLQASGRYGRYVTAGRGNKLRIDRAAARAAKRTDGKWVLITNDDTLSVEDAATAYKGLLVIERCFRSLKSTQIKMRPMFHWLPRRIEAHVKLCVLALLIERVAARDCEQSWPRLREALDRVQATEFHTDSHRFFRRNDLPDEARKILAKLAIKRPKQVLAIEDLTPDT